MVHQVQSISGGESGVDIAKNSSESNHFNFRWLQRQKNRHRIIWSTQISPQHQLQTQKRWELFTNQYKKENYKEITQINMRIPTPGSVSIMIFLRSAID